MADLPTNDLFSPELKWMKRVVFPGGDSLVSNNILELILILTVLEESLEYI